MKTSSDASSLQRLILGIFNSGSHETRHLILQTRQQTALTIKLDVSHTSASSISLRPKAARLRSATLKVVAGALVAIVTVKQR